MPPVTWSPGVSPPHVRCRRESRAPSTSGAPALGRSPAATSTTRRRSSGSAPADGSRRMPSTSVGEAIRPGVTTDELDAIAHEYVVAHDAYPSTLGYRGYPKSSCTSVNEVICHGIPDDTVLVDGDIVNIDVTAFNDGVHGDLNATFLVGEVEPEAAPARRAHPRGARPRHPGRRSRSSGQRHRARDRGVREAVRLRRRARLHRPRGRARRSTRGSSSRTTTRPPSSTPSWSPAWCSRSSRCSPSARASSGTCGPTTGPSSPATAASPRSSSTRSSSPSAAPRS